MTKDVPTEAEIEEAIEFLSRHPDGYSAEDSGEEESRMYHALAVAAERGLIGYTERNGLGWYYPTAPSDAPDLLKDKS
jgi:hypothetical protein